VPSWARSAGFYVDRGHRWEEITILFQFMNGKQLAVAGAGWAALQAAAKSCGLRTFTYSNPLCAQIRDGARSAICIHGMERAAR